jgi:hypothetical protein
MQEITTHVILTVILVQCAVQLSKVTEEYCWVTADVCDYTNFDFTWHPSEWQADMLHVFASDDQKSLGIHFMCMLKVF